MWKTFTDAFYLNFVADNRWKYLTEGLKTTLIITFFACLMGIVLGFLVGMIRSTYEKTHKLKVIPAITSVFAVVLFSLSLNIFSNMFSPPYFIVL